MARGLLTSSSPLAGLLAAPPKSGGVRDAKGQIGMAPAISTGAKEPERERRSGPGAMDYVWGLLAGYSPNDVRRTVQGYEDERLAADTRRAEMGRLGEVARGMGAEAEIAFALNPQAFGEAIASGFESATLDPGDIRIGAGGRPIASAPRIETMGDRFGAVDPITLATTFTDARPPSFAEQTARISASTENVAPGNRIVDVTTGEMIASAPDRATLSPGQVRFEGGNPVASVAPEERPPSAQVVEAQDTISTLETDVFPIFGRMETLLQSDDLIVGPGAGARLTAARARAALGDAEARRRVAATEEYQALAGRLRVGLAKSLGANPSDADLRLLEVVTGADLGQSPDGLRAVVAQGRGLAERQRAAAQSRVGQQQSGGSAPAPAAGVVSVSSPQEAQALPPGTRYRAPNGRIYVRE